MNRTVSQLTMALAIIGGIRLSVEANSPLFEMMGYIILALASIRHEIAYQTDKGK